VAATTNPRPDTPVRAVATRFAFSVGEIYEAMHINERDDYYALSGLGQFTMARFQRCRGRLLLMPSRRRRVRRMRFRKQGCARNEYGDDRGERKNLLHGIAPGEFEAGSLLRASPLCASYTALQLSSTCGPFARRGC